MTAVDNLITARESALTATTARKRLLNLFDPDSFVEIGGFAGCGGKLSGVVCGYGSVMGSPAYAFAQDIDQNSGAVNTMHAEKIYNLYSMALKTGAPVIGIYDSKGSAINEGAAVMHANAKILSSISALSGVVPQISLILGTCVGLNAITALSADFIIMTKKAEFDAVPGADNHNGSAEASAKSGAVHIIAEDEASATEKARRIISLLPINNLAPAPALPYTEAADAHEALRNACNNIVAADMAEISAFIADSNSVIEMFEGFGKGVFTALATVSGFACAIIATRGDSLSADDCNKIAGIVQICDSFQIPVINLVNSTGLSCEGDSCLNARNMAKLAHIYNEATTAKISVITGKAYGAAFVTMACNMDYTIAWPSAIISALAPETAVQFSFADRITTDKSREEVVAEYIKNEAGAINCAASGLIDDVIDPAVTRQALIAALDLLSAKRVHRNPKKHANIPM